MTRQLISCLACMLAPLLCISGAHAHSGGLDGNGCHYDGAAGNGYHCHQDARPNLDVTAVAKKSRDNICHDSASPNYRTLKYFITYRSMKDCMASGGRKPL
jgi:hypothetical protein